MIQHRRTDLATLRVKEIFQTIQGEGPLSGEPCVFVRLEGCNLKCWFCDTDFENGRQMHVAQILGEVEALMPDSPLGKKPLCVLTGGEPFAQDITVLVTSLLGRKWRVQIETAGTLWCDLPEDSDLDIVCSPKTPNVHPRIMDRATAWKYLIRLEDAFDPADGLPYSVTQDQKEAGGQEPQAKDAYPIAKPKMRAEVFLQPVEEINADMTDRNVTEAVRRAMRFGYRLSLQQHKILGLQ